LNIEFFTHFLSIKTAQHKTRSTTQKHFKIFKTMPYTIKNFKKNSIFK